MINERHVRRLDLEVIAAVVMVPFVQTQTYLHLFPVREGHEGISTTPRLAKQTRRVCRVHTFAQSQSCWTDLLSVMLPPLRSELRWCGIDIQDHQIARCGAKGQLYNLQQ